MKISKFLLVLVLGLVLALGMVACGSDDDDSSSGSSSNDPELIGTWELDSVGDMTLPAGSDMTLEVDSTTFTFSQDFTALGGDSCSEDGTWSTSDGELTTTVTSSDCDDTIDGETITQQYSVSGDTLTIESIDDETGESQTLVFDRVS